MYYLLSDEERELEKRQKIHVLFSPPNGMTCNVARNL